jgi:acetamidase/formamidase
LGSKILYNDRFLGGTLGPETEMLGPIEDGGSIVFNTAPGCWGPMITPVIRDGHECNIPVAVEGAEVGDSILIKIKKIVITSKASSSGTHKFIQERREKCPKCGEVWPEVVVEGTGLEAIKCAKCGSPVSPYSVTNGYTMVFDDDRAVGLTVNSEINDIISNDASAWGAIPRNSRQVSSLIANQSDIPGLVSRVIPFMGQLGTTPSIDIPSTNNSGDSRAYYESREHLTDGHMDIDSVREGSMLVCPVKVKGGGIYAGDMHAQQGDGEIAGHTTDVSGEVTVEVSVIKNLTMEGPLLFPVVEDLPPLARPFTEEEKCTVEAYSQRLGIELEPNAPVQVVGSGLSINEAVDDGLKRASDLFGMKLEEVKNRATITGGIEIGRLPGLVHITLKVPISTLEKLGLIDFVKEQYQQFF